MNYCTFADLKEQNINMKNTEIYPTYPMKKRSLKGVLLRCVALLMVLGTTLPAMAQTNYVFLYPDGSTFHILHKNANNNNLSDASTFNPTYAIWSGSSGSNFVNNNRRLSINNNAVGTSGQDRASTISGNTIYRYTNNSNYYLRYNNGWTSTATAGNATQCVYVVSGPTTKDWVTSTLAITASGNVTSFNTTGNTTLSTSATYSDAHYTMTANSGSPTYYAISGQSPTTSAPSTAAPITWAPNNTSGWTLTSGIYDDGHVRINTTTGYVEYYNEYDDDTELVIKATASATGLTDKTGTYTISIEVPKVDPEGISVTTPMTVYIGQTGTISYTLTPSPCYNNVTYTSNNTSIATVNNSGVVTGIAVGSTTITVSAYTIGGTTSGALTGTVTVNVRNRIANPVITFTATGTNNQATCEITCATVTPVPTIRYTVNGVDPTASTGTVYTGAFTVDDGVEVRAIAVTSADGWDNSGVTTNTWTSIIPTGVVGTVVTINDLEDHTWTYYSTKPDDDYPDALHSPDPRNVKITYYANGYRHDGANYNAVTGVQLSHNETANTFVYYETLEKTPGGQILTGNYPYKVIPNPFSKRPKNGDTYYGFEGWRIKSGGNYINGHNNNDILDLEEVIHFENLDAGYTPNVISAEIELEAIWAPATVVTNTTNNLTAAYSYERNFIVCNANISISNLAQNATVSSRYPDGTAYGNANTTVTGITVNNTSGDIKVEYIGVSGTFNGPNNKWLIVGRGCEGEISQTLSQQNNVKFRLESGTHVYVHPRPNTTGIMVMGSDYDRAQGDNGRLRIVNYVTANGGGAPAANSIAEFMDITIKSGFYGFKSELESNDTYGNYGLGVGGNTDNTTYTPDPALGGSGTYYNYSGTASGSWQRTLSFYCGGTRGGGTGGIIRVMIEGGELSSLNGGGTKNQAANYGVIMHHIRMKGGWVKGAIYGTASASSSAGSTRLVLTGGEVNGWVAGACNGTRSDGDYHGELQGNCFIYVGGNAELRSHNNDGVYNNRWGLVFNVQGGTVFGAGKGIDDRVNYVGSANSTIVSVSDNAYIEQAVYGGAFHGVSKESRIYLTGNAHVGNIYGGSFEPVHADNEATWRCNNTDIRMYGGNVTGGIYGGHNAKGTVYQTTTLQINGGQVGVDANHTANIHGGGYGNVTSVSGNVTVTLGDSPANSGGVTVYGNVYGGSALGDVNTSSTNTTIVTLNKGTVNGNLFGGALGVGADVNGKITVTIAGGIVNGNVFGGGDAAAYSPNANFPIVKMTGGTVTNIFGGGNGDPNDATQETAKVTGNPQVTLSGNAHVTGNVYGGGNAAKVDGNTKVLIKD